MQNRQYTGQMEVAIEVNKTMCDNGQLIYLETKLCQGNDVLSQEQLTMISKGEYSECVQTYDCPLLRARSPASDAHCLG